MPEVMLTAPDYDPAHGVVILPEGGDVLVRHGEFGVEILPILLDCAIWRDGASHWRMSRRPTAFTSTSIRERCR